MDVVLWVVVVLLIGLGLAGTVLPVLPGAAFVFLGVLLGAWIDDFERVSTGAVVAVAVLAVLSSLLDYVAGLLGAKKAGASQLAMVGAAIGTVVGLLMGLVGVLFMPLVGAAVGEAISRRREPDLVDTGRQSLKVGVATWLGMLAGMLAKVVLSFVMVGIFVAALVA